MFMDTKYIGFWGTSKKRDKLILDANKIEWNVNYTVKRILRIITMCNNIVSWIRYEYGSKLLRGTINSWVWESTRA